MGFLKLNRFEHPSGSVFDPEKVLQQLREAFPEMKTSPGDQAALSAQRAAQGGAADIVVQTLRRNAEAYGPAYAFEIPMHDGACVQGRARRHDVTFLFPDPLSEEWRRRLLAFLQKLGPGKLETTKGSETPES